MKLASRGSRRSYSGPNPWRTSPSPSPTIFQKRFDSSIASSFDRTSISAKPTTASFASVNGPSVTGDLSSRGLDVRAPRVKAARREQHSGLGQLLYEPAHLGHEPLVRLVAARARHQEPHSFLSFCTGFGYRGC